MPIVEPGADLGDDGPSYEVMYLLRTDDDRIPALREALMPLGDSLVVVGGEGLWNVHVHVDDVGAAIEAGIAAGRRSGSRSPTSPSRSPAPHRCPADARSSAPSPEPAWPTSPARAGGTPLLFGPDTQLTVGHLAAAIRESGADEVICLPNRAGHIAMFEAAAAAARDPARGSRCCPRRSRSRR